MAFASGDDDMAQIVQILTERSARALWDKSDLLHLHTQHQHTHTPTCRYIAVMWLFILMHISVFMGLLFFINLYFKE